MSSIVFKAAQFVTLTTEASDELTGYIFGLDAQLLFDIAIQMLVIFLLFLALSYFLFNPARKLMQSRRDKIQDEMDFSAKEKADAIQLKKEYTAKVKEADKEVDEILSAARKKAVKQEGIIVDDAKQEAARIIENANKEVELEKTKVKDEVKQQIIDVASFMAGKIIEDSIDPAKQAKLIDETLDEMGDGTWQR